MIKLYTAATPNGWKVTVLLEEIDIDYELHVVNLSLDEQKTKTYTAINPNGRVPATI